MSPSLLNGKNNHILKASKCVAVSEVHGCRSFATCTEVSHKAALVDLRGFKVLQLNVDKLHFRLKCSWLRIVRK